MILNENNDLRVRNSVLKVRNSVFYPQTESKKFRAIVRLFYHLL